MDDETHGNAIPSSMLVGEDLSKLSVAELRERITFLEIEILRIKKAIADKESGRSAAESIFKS